MFVLRLGGVIVGAFTMPQPHDPNVVWIADDDPELIAYWNSVIPNSPIQTYMPEYYEQAGAERYTSIPVVKDNVSEYSRCILLIPMPHPAAGEIWDISAEVHGTNDEGYNVYLTTEVRVGPTTGNPLEGLWLVKASGSFNVTPDAHHALINRRGIIKWTQEMVDQVALMDQPYLKFMVWAGSSAAVSGAKLSITPNRGHLRCLRYSSGA